MALGKPRKLLVDLVADRYVNLDHFYKNQEEKPNGCVEWTGITSNIGYGFIGFIKADGSGKGMMTTHRLAWMVENNRVPSKRNINHTCHNKLCVHPDHLIEGTQQDKLSDMRRDNVYMGGRKPGQFPGSYNHKQTNRTYKYSEAEIQWVRNATTDEIAQKYNISKRRAVHKRWSFRNSYKWLPLPEVK